MQGVYKIVNSVNGKIYVGSSVNIEKRFKQHKFELEHNTHNNRHLQGAWNTYGKDNFDFVVVEIVPDLINLRERECYYIKSLNCTDPNIGYNMLNDTNIGLGVLASIEIRKKISEACVGERNGNYGRKHTPDEIQKIKENRWGKDYVKKPRKKAPRKTPEELKKSYQIVAEKARGRKVSIETRKKLSDLRKGKKHSAKTLEKYREQRKGENNANCKLSKQQVLEIYEKMNRGVNYKIVCAEYGVGQCQVYKIKRKEHWVFNDEQ